MTGALGRKNYGILLLYKNKRCFSAVFFIFAVFAVLPYLFRKFFLVDFDEVGEEHGKTVSRKLLRLADTMEPFVRINDDSSGFNLEKSTSGLNHILVDSLCYSMLTQNESLGMYNNVISDLIKKDKPWAEEIAEESKIIVEQLVQQNLKQWYPEN